MKFVSDLKAFVYPDSTVTQLMGPVIANEDSKGRKILWIVLTGVLLIGCGYLSYRFGSGLVGDDE